MRSRARPTRPAGCVFHTRCHRFIEGTCDVIEPPVVELEVGHRIRCHLPVDELGRTHVAECSAPDAVAASGGRAGQARRGGGEQGGGDAAAPAFIRRQIPTYELLGEEGWR